MDRKQLRQHENKILVGLVDFFYESGYKLEAYIDPNTGGIYENKLGNRLGYKVMENNMLAPEFLTAAQMLEAKGYVRRIQRSPASSLLGIWPTRTGLDRAEYLKANWFKKALHFLRDNGKSITVSAITTIVTLFIAWLFRLFGLGN